MLYRVSLQGRLKSYTTTMFNFMKNLMGTKDSKEIEVDPQSQAPTKLWNKLKKEKTVMNVQPMDPSTSISDDKIRFVCISDTHAQIERGTLMIPDGDCLIHAGDITNVGMPKELEAFNNFLGKLPHRHKIVIAGNHDLTLDDDLVTNKPKYLSSFFNVKVEDVQSYLKERNLEKPVDLLTNCTYLQDAYTVLCGIHIYGSPWQPEFGGWGFNLTRGQSCLDKWNMIPSNTDILITHGPPLGYGDLCYDGIRAGCVELLNTIQQRVKPKYHIFGHIHENYGITSDGVSTYINASTCTLRYQAVHPPIVFDFPIPEGHTKDEAIGAVVSCSSQTTSTQPEEEQKLETNSDSDDNVLFEEN